VDYWDSFWDPASFGEAQNERENPEVWTAVGPDSGSNPEETAKAASRVRNSRNGANCKDRKWVWDNPYALSNTGALPGNA